MGFGPFVGHSKQYSKTKLKLFGQINWNNIKWKKIIIIIKLYQGGVRVVQNEIDGAR